MSPTIRYWREARPPVLPASISSARRNRPGSLDLVAELISDDLIDHIVQPGLDGKGQARNRNHVAMTRAMYSDFRSELDP